jgi:hypothetical protein
MKASTGLGIRRARKEETEVKEERWSKYRIPLPRGFEQMSHAVETRWLFNADLVLRLKGDPAKMAPAQRPRSETTS